MPDAFPYGQELIITREAAGEAMDAFSAAAAAERPVFGGACKEAEVALHNLTALLFRNADEIADEKATVRSTLVHNLQHLIDDDILDTECLRNDDVRETAVDLLDQVADAVREGDSATLERSARDLSDHVETKAGVPSRRPVVCYDVDPDANPEDATDELERRLSIEVAARDEDPVSLAIEEMRACVLFGKD